jgi:eukaryotic-like serine/threonine-protein kinase
MSPEQALGRRVLLDGRTDIYSLGVTLYELLTLTPAVDGRDRAEILRRIAQDDPPPLRKLNPSVPLDLETVVHKAMSREAADRYATPQDLADDLNRFLLDRPIRARPPTLADRGRKWCRRHKPLVATAAVCLVVSVIGLSVSTVLIAREQGRTRAALAESRQRSNEAQQVIDFLVQDVFGAAAPGGSYDRSMTVGELFDRADAAIGDRFRQQPLVEASVRLALARSHSNIGDGKRAVPHAAHAVELRTRALGAEHPLTLQAMREQADILSRAYQYAASEEVLRKLFTVHSRRLGPAHAETLDCEIFLAYILFKLGRSDEALALAAQAEALALRHLGPLHYHTLYAWDILGQIVASRGDRERGAELLRRAIAGREQTVGPLDRSVLWCMKNLAQIVQDQGRLDEARRILLDLVERNSRVYGLAHVNNSQALGLLIALLRTQGDFAVIRDLCQGWAREMLDTPLEADPFLRDRRSIRLGGLVRALVTLPEPIPIDVDLAVRAAEEAGRLSDGKNGCVTLALLYSRAGRADLAAQAIEKAKARPDWATMEDDYAWLVEALIRARRGELTEARRLYDLARNRPKPTAFGQEQYQGLQQSVETLLGLMPSQKP